MGWVDFIVSGLLLSFLSGTNVGIIIRNLLIHHVRLVEAEAIRFALMIRDRLLPLFKLEILLFFIFVLLYTIACNVKNETIGQYIFTLASFIMLVMGIISLIFLKAIPKEEFFDNHPRAKEIAKFVQEMIRPLYVVIFWMSTIAISMICVPRVWSIQIKVAMLGIIVLFSVFSEIVKIRTNILYWLNMLLLLLCFGLRVGWYIMDQYADNSVAVAVAQNVRNHLNELFAITVSQPSHERAKKELACYEWKVNKWEVNDKKKIELKKEVLVTWSKRKVFRDNIFLVYVVDEEKIDLDGCYVIEDYVTNYQDKKTMIKSLKYKGDEEWVLINRTDKPVQSYVTPEPVTVKSSFGCAPKPNTDAVHCLFFYEDDKETLIADFDSAIYEVETGGTNKFFSRNPYCSNWSGKHFVFGGVEGYVSEDRPIWVKIVRD